MGFRIIRIDPNGLAELLFSLSVFPLQGVETSQGIVRFFVPWIGLDRFLE